jgi:hypothetical protein
MGRRDKAAPCCAARDRRDSPASWRAIVAAQRHQTRQRRSWDLLPNRTPDRARGSTSAGDRHFCDAGDPQAKGVVERLQAFIETSFEPGRRFANELDFRLQLDGWFDTRANASMHKTLRCRPSDRLIEEREEMAPRWSAGASRRASPTARCWRSRLTPASWPAGTRGRSRVIERSPRSNTPAPQDAARAAARLDRTAGRSSLAGRL